MPLTVTVSNASASTPRESSFNPVLMEFQLLPPSVLLNTPPPVPAYNVDGFVGLIKRHLMSVSVRPAFTGLQLIPPSVLLKMPPVLEL